MEGVRCIKPYGLVKNLGEFIVVSDPNTKVPLHNFDNWKNFSMWLKQSKKTFKGSILY